jgi:hypothetical protein
MNFSPSSNVNVTDDIAGIEKETNIRVKIRGIIFITDLLIDVKI